MERKELYAKIQQLNLQEEVKKTYGKNYTQVGNSDLETVIKNHNIQQTETPTPSDNSEKETLQDPVEDHNATSNPTTDNPYEAACLLFLGILKDTDILDGLMAKL